MSDHSMCGGKPFHVRYLNDYYDEGIRWITAQLDEAVREDRQTHNEKVEEVRKEIYEEGFAAGIEKAAEVAENHNGCVDIECLSKSNCGATAANQIRALKADR